MPSRHRSCEICGRALAAPVLSAGEVDLDLDPDQAHHAEALASSVTASSLRWQLRSL